MLILAIQDSWVFTAPKVAEAELVPDEHCFGRCPPVKLPAVVGVFGKGTLLYQLQVTEFVHAFAPFGVLDKLSPRGPNECLAWYQASLPFLAATLVF